MGILISGPSYIYGDNMSVVHDTVQISSKKEKHLSSLCESVAMGESLVGYIPSTENVTDPMTKVLYGHKRRYLTTISNQIILYRLQSDKLDPIVHFINLKRTRKMWPCIYPD